MITYEKSTGGPQPFSIFVNVAPPLLLPTGFGPAILVTTNVVGGDYPIPAQPAAVRGIDGEASLAYDVSGRLGGEKGRVYLAYVGTGFLGGADTDIHLRFSDDAGQTWSAASRINDDPGQNSQFMPQFAVDQASSNVAIAWHDARHSPGNNTAEMYATVLLAGGATPQAALTPSSSSGNISTSLARTGP